MRYVDIGGETFPEDALDIWIEEEDEEEDHDPALCNEWNGYRVEPHTNHEYVCPDWPHSINE